MSTPVIVAIADGEAIRTFARNGNGLVQVAQFLNRGGLDPAELAGVLADLSDTFAWTGTPPPVHAPAPRPLKAKTAPKAIPTAPRKYRSAEEIEEEHERCLDYIRIHPGCSRTDIRLALWPEVDKPAGAAMVQARLNKNKNRWRVVPGSGIEPDQLYVRD
jgi:hypothetical protein